LEAEKAKTGGKEILPQLHQITDEMVSEVE
jgi:hypothetical protein